MPEDPRDWEDEEDIPGGLAKRWQEDERKGLRAGVCKSCGYTFGQDELSCPHCEIPVHLEEKPLPGLWHFYTATPMGILLVVILLLGAFFVFTNNR